MSLASSSGTYATAHSSSQRKRSEQAEKDLTKVLHKTLYPKCLSLFREGLKDAQASGVWGKQQLLGLTNCLSRLYAWGEDISEHELELCTLRSQALLVGITEIMIDLAETLLQGETTLLRFSPIVQGHACSEAYR